MTTEVQYVQDLCGTCQEGRAQEERGERRKEGRKEINEYVARSLKERLALLQASCLD
jgi:hypothetical protein